MVTALGDLSDQLRRMPDFRGEPERVTKFLLSHPVDPASLEPYIAFEPGVYTRSSVYRDDSFEILVLSWSPGSRSPIHDHGGNRCWLVPQSGAFFVDDFVRVEGGRRPGPVLLEQCDAGCLRIGELDTKGFDDVHDIHAIHVERPSVSLHVYAAPIGNFYVYDRQRRSCDVRSFAALDVFDYVI